MNNNEQESSRETELQEIKKSEKKIILWGILILCVFILGYIFQVISANEKLLDEFQHWFQSFKITWLALIDVVFIIIAVIISLCLFFIARKKVNEWDGYDKEVRLDLDKYLNGFSTMGIFLLYVGMMLFTIICSDAYGKETSLYESIIYFIISDMLIFTGIYGGIICYFLHKSLQRVYDQKREEGWKNHLKSEEEINQAKKELEIDTNRVEAKAFKLANKILQIGICISFMLSFYFDGFVNTTIIIGVMWLIIYCYYVINVTKV